LKRKGSANSFNKKHQGKVAKFSSTMKKLGGTHGSSEDFNIAAVAKQNYSFLCTYKLGKLVQLLGRWRRT